MSASPTTAAPSAKRPLEEPSSPSGPSDQPDAKRPALDKMVKEDPDVEDISAAEPVKGEAGDAKVEDVKGEDVKPAVDASSQNGTKDGQGDTIVPDAPAQSMPMEVQPIQSTSGPNGRPTSQPQHQDETGWLHLRAIISSAEAATVIGKGGENVTLIRRMSGAKCTVSDYSRGAVERILTVSGLVDAVSKVRPRKLRPYYIYQNLLTLSGIWPYHSYTEQ